MTNEDVVKAFEKTCCGRYEITEEMHDFITKNYKQVDNDFKDGDFKGVHIPGTDYKLGRYAADPVKQIWRNVTFHEFYENATVD